MDLGSFAGNLSDTAVDAIVVGLPDDGSFRGMLADLDRATQGTIRRLVQAGEASGKLLDLTHIRGPQGLETLNLLLIGTGEPAALSVGTAFQIAATAAKHLASKPRQRVVMGVTEAWQPAWHEAAVAGVLVGCEGQDLYRAERKRMAFRRCDFAAVAADELYSGRVLGESVNLARRLVNEPPSEIYPESFAARAAAVGKETGLEIEIWGEERLQQERCGALLGVARGSGRSPRMVIANYRGGPPDAPVLALVGKGVTFDSGGLSIKPTDGMKTMKCDMAGAATVLGALRAISLLRLPVNVTGLMGLVENMIGPDSYKLGDVLTARNGRTIEIHNTDAEGRLVLADVLSVAVDRGASRIIDLATLTGACVVALGTDVAGLMTNDETWCRQIRDASWHCGEAVWQLPMFADFATQIRSDVADIKNVGEGRWGGAITAAKFLEEFVAGKPWTHIDIAGPAFLEKPKPWIDGGGSGVMVRTLVQVARQLAASAKPT